MAAGCINLTNQFLIAMPGMADDRFAGSVVYLCEHNAEGALGLVINKPIDITLAHLFEKIDLSLELSIFGEQPVYRRSLRCGPRRSASRSGPARPRADPRPNRCNPA